MGIYINDEKALPCFPRLSSTVRAAWRDFL